MTLEQVKKADKNQRLNLTYPAITEKNGIIYYNTRI
jgi:hypothetical protein